MVKRSTKKRTSLLFVVVFLFSLVAMGGTVGANNSALLDELPEMLIIGGKGFTIDYIREHRPEPANSAIAAALVEDPDNLFLWQNNVMLNIRSKEMNDLDDIAWVMDNLEGYWNAAGEWIKWKYAFITVDVLIVLEGVKIVDITVHSTNIEGAAFYKVDGTIQMIGERSTIHTLVDNLALSIKDDEDQSLANKFIPVEDFDGVKFFE